MKRGIGEGGNNLVPTQNLRSSRKIPVAKHGVEDIGERLVEKRGGDFEGLFFGIAGLPQPRVIAQHGHCPDESRRPATLQIPPVQAENLDRDVSPEGQPRIGSRAQREFKMLIRILSRRIDEQWPTVRVPWKEFAFLMAVAVRTGQQMIRPVEGT